VDSFVWNDNYNTHLPVIDEQHHRLVDLINEFGRLVSQNGVVTEDIDRVYRDLAAYAEFHFTDEERGMEKHGLDDRHIREHQKQHYDFLQEVRAARKAVHKGSIDASRSLLEFLVSWLAYHILCVDQNMARQIAMVKEGHSAARAYDLEETENDSRTEPLLAALNRLFSQISERNLELKEVNATLEKNVRKRTKKLLAANQKLEAMALTDELTGLPNRRQMMWELEQLWKEAVDTETPLALLMIDADGFKEINDNYGHPAGDTVLAKLARELKYAVRNDDVVCRLGGDEFTILCPDTDKEGALHIAEQVRLAVNAMEVAAGKGVWYGSVSIGVAVRRPDMKWAESLMKAADNAVYAAKEAGKNCVRYQG
jgi:diguanylate cyclase (GGDEF)-like protein/hemerythrin-like metal-binding protein